MTQAMQRWGGGSKIKNPAKSPKIAHSGCADLDINVCLICGFSFTIHAYPSLVGL